MSSPTRSNAMHRALAGLVALSALLAACQVQLPAAPAARKSPRGDEAPRTATPRPGTPVAPAAVTSPTGPGPALPGPAVTPAPVLDLLMKPAGLTMLVAGAVRLDGSYIVAAGAGNIVAAGAGNIVAAGAGNILSHNGGQVLSHNGGQIVAAGAGNIISQNGGQIVAAGAGNLLSHNGGQLVAAGAGNILSHNGGQIVAAGAGNYALLQASGVQAGEIAPVAGAEVAVRSLRTGQYLPLGVDAAGKPVYVVYTNLAGQYDLYVPASEQGNVMIEANVLRAQRNARLEYQNISGVDAGIDEDTTLVTQVLRRSLATRLRIMFRKADRQAAMDSLLGASNSRIDGAGEGARQLLETAFGRIWDVANEVGLTREPDDQVRLTYAFAATDAMLRKFDVNAAKVRPGKWWDGEEEPAIPALVQIVRQAREKATEAMRRDPLFHTKLAWFNAANARAVASKRRAAPYAIERPADLGTLVIEEFIVIDSEDPTLDFSRPLTNSPDKDAFHLDALVTAFESIGANGVPPAISPGGRGDGPDRRTADGRDQVDRLNQAQFEIVLQMVTHLLTLGAEEQAEISDTVRRYKDRQPPTGSASPTP